MENKMDVKWVPLSGITPYAGNAKKHPKDQIKNLAESLRQFGWKQPLVIDGNGVICIGHGRYAAAKLLKLDSAPCLIADDLTDEQIKKLRLADNKLNESDWDLDILISELDGLDWGDLDLDWGIDSLDDSKEAVDDEYDANPPEEPKSKRGQVYQLGRHRLMCGDSTSLSDVQTLVGGVQVDMLLTDPPYGVDYTGKTKDALKIENDAKTDDDLLLFLTDAFKAANEVMKPGAVFYIWHAILKTPAFESACQMAGWEVRQVLIWVKNSMVLGRQDYQWKHEPCLYGWKEGAGHLWASDRKQTTVLNFDKPTRNAEHPTMKPIPLFDYQMQNNTKGGDVVLDLFGGSGTTIMAAEQNGRTGYVMEFDPKYVDVIIDRWEKFTGEKAVLLDAGEN